MANINISNLSGSDLCNDSDSYLIDITDDAENILGGGIVDRIVAAGRAIKNIFFPEPEPKNDTLLMCNDGSDEPRC
jgi:hypothetical protein